MDVIGMVGKSAEGLKHLETLRSSAATMFNLLICWYCFYMQEQNYRKKDQDDRRLTKKNM